MGRLIITDSFSFFFFFYCARWTVLSPVGLMDRMLDSDVIFVFLLAVCCAQAAVTPACWQSQLEPNGSGRHANNSRLPGTNSANVTKLIRALVLANRHTGINHRAGAPVLLD